MTARADSEVVSPGGMNAFETSRQQTTTSGRLRLKGAVALADRGGLTAVLVPLEHVDHVLVDLSQTTYIDSTVLGCLLDLHKRMVLNGHRGAISILGASPNLMRLFEITGLSKVFEIEGIDVLNLFFQQDLSYSARGSA